ncbi:MAG: eL32 family ribosomal protein [Candidatus Nanoarchaeia archaeon]|jgi:large subunit ribosomal protein L32e|nr:eL32 family ribosomal protein [Candidatus Nanoarchaeia archaeon]|tara:strand:+ start:6157 stop:6783 length:627 start_codon:yes stop_codon:yes gene_type:complete
MKELITQKIAMKKKMPKFRRQEAHVKARLSRTGWRKPRGVHSKMRRQRKGYNAIVKVGYRTPKLLRGRLRSGLFEVEIRTPEELKNITKDQIALIPRTLGNKKRLAILQEAKKMKVNISNFPMVEDKIKEIESGLVSRKKKRSEVKTKKTAKAKKAEEAKEKKDKKEEEKKAESKEEKKSETKEKPKVKPKQAPKPKQSKPKKEAPKK